MLLLGTSCMERRSLEELAAEKQEEIVQKDRVYFRNVLGIGDYGPSPDYLKSNRESALASAAPWLSNGLIDTMDFLDFVLPHQVNNAVGENWRGNVGKRITVPSFPGGKVSREAFIDFCNQINDLLGKDNVFGKTDGDESFYRYTDYGLKKGSCIAMSDYANYTFRALGIPVASDFVPVWGNLNSAGHTWNRLLMKGASYAFMGSESNIGVYEPLVITKYEDGSISAAKIPPKVYRLARYSRNASDFFGSSVVDVTGEYVDVRDIFIDGQQDSPSDIYLSTFNRGRYIINCLGQKDGKRIVFRDMAVGLVYFPVKLDRATPTPVGYPIVCSEKGDETKKPDLRFPMTVRVDHLSSLAEEQFNIINELGYGFLDSLDYNNMDAMCPKPVSGYIYELYYWDFGWKKHDVVRCTADGLVFENVPGNGIYIVKPVSGELRECRPFAYEEQGVKWF